MEQSQYHSLNIRSKFHFFKVLKIKNMIDSHKCIKWTCDKDVIQPINGGTSKTV